MLIVIVISIILIILIISLFSLVHIEHSNIIYISKEHACGVMSNKNYLDRFNTIDKLTRNVNDNNIEKIYCDNVLEFGIIEKNSISWIINLLRLKLSNLPILQEWRFIKINNKIENGLPHTRDNIIVLPNNILNKFYNI